MYRLCTSWYPWESSTVIVKTLLKCLHRLCASFTMMEILAHSCSRSIGSCVCGWWGCHRTTTIRSIRGSDVRVLTIEESVKWSVIGCHMCCGSTGGDSFSMDAYKGTRCGGRSWYDHVPGDDVSPFHFVRTSVQVWDHLFHGGGVCEGE